MHSRYVAASWNTRVVLTKPHLCQQFHFLVHVYKGMVKDRILLSAEVMHEYDQKVGLLE